MFDEALDAYNHAYNLTPYYPSNIINISNIYRKKNRLEDALNVLLDAKKSKFYKKGFKEVIDKHIADIEKKIESGYVYKPRKKTE